MLHEGQERVPTGLKKFLKFDAELTKNFLLWANRIVDVGSIRMYLKGLEISCHGLPWFGFWMAFTWVFNNTSLIPMQVNMLFGLVVDIILIAVCKAYFRRRRPQANKDDALGQMGPDVYSFPSGHASRAVFVAFFFMNLYPSPVLGVVAILWAIAVCISRILMNRHYIFDVVGGCFLGILEGLIMYVLWLDDSTAIWFMSFLSDEKLDGGEYHV